MKAEDFTALIRLRLENAGVDASAEAIAGSAAYLAILARWNQRINLTAFNLDRPSHEAIDRLIVEPLSAARFVHADDRSVVDIGSGGGSPALPFKLAAPRLRTVLIEARTRKSAFLREAARTLELADVRVDTARFDEQWMTENPEAVDVVTMRAVRTDEALWRYLGKLVRPGGRLFWFVDLVTSPIVASTVPLSGWAFKSPGPGQDHGLAILTRIEETPAQRPL